MNKFLEISNIQVWNKLCNQELEDNYEILQTSSMKQNEYNAQFLGDNILLVEPSKPQFFYGEPPVYILQILKEFVGISNAYIGKQISGKLQ